MNMSFSPPPMLSALCGILLMVAAPIQTRAAQNTKTIVETAVDAGSFGTLVAAVKAADLAETLSSPGPFTVFAPTDEAFAKLPAGTVQNLLLPENKDQLISVLTYHVVPGRVAAADVVNLSGAKTVQGQRIDISSTDAGVSVDNASVVSTDIQCSNGIIHVIDRVLLPSTQTIPQVASEAGQFGTLLAAAEAAGLVPVLAGDGPLTVFAPTDDAFSTLPKGTVASLLEPKNLDQLKQILTYHVVAGRVYSEDALSLSNAPTVAGPSIQITPTDAGANINNAKLISTDIDAANGVIHVIDRVLLPSNAPESEGKAASMKPPAPVHSISAKDVLLGAINRGVPAFNSGDHHGCADIYMEALQSVSTMAATGLSDHSMNQINATIQSCQQMHSATDKAWTLRRRMDQLLMEL